MQEAGSNREDDKEGKRAVSFPMLLWAFSCLLVGSYAASSEMLDEFDDIGFMPYPPPAPASGGIAGSSCVFSPAGTNLHFDLSPMKQTSHDFTSATAGG